MYVGAMLRPMLPLAEYYANYDYIKEELCKNRDKPILKCNGSCYVEELMKRDNLLPNENSHKTTAPSSLIYFPIFILEDLAYELSVIRISKDLKTPNYTKHFIVKGYINTIYRPPKVA